MKKRIKKICDYLKNKIKNIISVLRNPGGMFADFIFFVYRRNKDAIPLPILMFVIKHMGPWAGISLYLPIRQYRYKLTINKFKNTLFFIFILLCIIVLPIVIDPFLDNNKFYFGFFQNLLSDIILIILTIYLLPRILNPSRKYNVSLISSNKMKDENITEFIISIINTGEEIYRAEEIYWEIFVPYDFLKKNEISYALGDCEVNEELFTKMWKFCGINKTPLFLEHEQHLLILNFNIGTMYGSTSSPLKIYYRIRTINGNIPTLERITKDFMGMGMSIEKYPKVGELIVNDWPDPEHYST